MDPVDCLVSRFENLRRIPEKQNEVGIWQAGIAISACRAYLAELILPGDERKAIKAATAIFQLGGSASGLQAYKRYGLDILAAIPLDRFRTERFRNGQAARSLATIRKAREELSRPRTSRA